MDYIILILYVVFSWMAIDKVWYSKRVYLVGDSLYFYMKKFLMAFFLGWIMIPIAIVMKIVGK